jgi:hypothetical protein
MNYEVDGSLWPGSAIPATAAAKIGDLPLMARMAQISAEENDEAPAFAGLLRGSRMSNAEGNY